MRVFRLVCPTLLGLMILLTQALINPGWIGTDGMNWNRDYLGYWTLTIWEIVTIGKLDVPIHPIGPHSPQLSQSTPVNGTVCKGTFYNPMMNWYGLICPKMDRNILQITGFTSIFLLRELKYSKNREIFSFIKKSFHTCQLSSDL